MDQIGDMSGLGSSSEIAPPNADAYTPGIATPTEQRYPKTAEHTSAHKPHATARERTATPPKAPAEGVTPAAGKLVLHRMLAERTWDGEPAPDEPDIPRTKLALDNFQAPGTADRVASLLRTAWQNGADVVEIPRGESLPEEFETNEVLRIMRDLKIEGGGPTFDAEAYVAPEVFDEEAREMVNDYLYQGPSIVTRVRRQDGSHADILRRVAYLRPTASGLRLVGRPSELALERNAGYTYERKMPVRSVVRTEENGRVYTDRLIRAQLIRPLSTTMQDRADVLRAASTKVKGQLSQLREFPRRLRGS